MTTRPGCTSSRSNRTANPNPSCTMKARDLRPLVINPDPRQSEFTRPRTVASRSMTLHARIGYFRAVAMDSRNNSSSRTTKESAAPFEQITPSRQTRFRTLPGSPPLIPSTGSPALANQWLSRTGRPRAEIPRRAHPIVGEARERSITLALPCISKRLFCPFQFKIDDQSRFRRPVSRRLQRRSSRPSRIAIAPSKTICVRNTAFKLKPRGRRS